MGKDWDAALPARAIWAEVLRVLKPGASCFVCAGARQDTILGLLTDLREVGFDIQHSALSWVYWSGFPKSTDVGKDFDKAAFLGWVKEQPLTILPECPFEHKHKAFAKRSPAVHCPECRRRVWALQAGYSNEVTRADVRKAASAAVNGAYSTDPQNHANTPDNMISACGANGRPWMVEYGKGTGTLLLTALQARFGDAPGVRAKAADYMAPRQVERGTFRPEWTESIGTQYTEAMRDSDGMQKHSTSPATPDAVKWDGWHSGSVPLKPSAEQILWVTKPAEPGPARLNVLKWGTGAVNIGECRMPFDGDDDTPSQEQWNRMGSSGSAGANGYAGQFSQGMKDAYANGAIPVPSGRYPSNLLVSSRALGDDSKYGDLEAWAQARNLSPEWLDAALSAGVLRVPKPSRSEKNAGCEGLEEKPSGGMEGNVPGARETLRVAGDGVTPIKPVVSRNHHPTTKPVTLFAFLCTLACPRGGTVLDPFLGSGTTAVAAVQCGMHFIGIEREPEYVAIAEARIAAALRNKQPTLALEAAE